MFSKYEIMGFGVAVFLLAVGLFLVRVDSTGSLVASVGSSNSQPDTGVVVAQDTADLSGVGNALVDASSQSGQLRQLVVDDVVVGTGPEVEEGDTVVVNYVGRLQDGTEFDNSYNRGAPFTFTVGQGRVIAGWEEGIVGMQEGGQRILIIPQQLAYGDRGVGAIPPNSTLIFAVELLEIQ